MGCPAIFLLGHQTKDVAPIPILVRSGDIIIMSGESRYCYHGVAGVLGFDEIGEVNPFANAIATVVEGRGGEGFGRFEEMCELWGLGSCRGGRGREVAGQRVVDGIGAGPIQLPQRQAGLGWFG